MFGEGIGKDDAHTREVGTSSVTARDVDFGVRSNILSMVAHPWID